MTFYQRILLIAIPGLMLGIIPAPGISLRFGWQLFSIWIAAAVFAGTILRSWWLRLFFILCFLTVLRYGPIATSYLTLLTIAVFMAAIEGVRDIEPAKNYNAMTVAAILLIAYGCAQFGGIMRYFPPLSPAVTMGPFNINEASAFFAMCLPVCFGRDMVSLAGWTFPRYRLLPVPVLGVMLSRSTTGFIAAAAACVVFGLLGGVSKRIFAVGMFVMLYVGILFFTLVDPPGEKDMIRPQIWKHIVRSYRSELFGRGLGSFEQLFPVMIVSDTELVKKSGGGWIIHAHNEYLQAGFEIGIPALGLILVFLGATYRRAWRWRKSLTEHDLIALSGLAATAVAAANFHTFHVAPTALLGCVWIGRTIGKGQGARV